MNSSSYPGVDQLRDLLDVDMSGVADTYVLSYDSGTDTFVWVSQSGGGGGGTPGGDPSSIQTNDGSGGFAGDDFFQYNGSQVQANCVSSYGGVKVYGRSGSEASISLQPDNVSDGSAGQWILGTKTSGLNNNNDFSFYSGELDGPVIFLQSATGFLGVNNNNPSQAIDVNGNIAVNGNIDMRGNTIFLQSISDPNWQLGCDNANNIIAQGSGATGGRYFKVINADTSSAVFQVEMLGGTVNLTGPLVSTDGNLTSNGVDLILQPNGGMSTGFNLFLNGGPCANSFGTAGDVTVQGGIPSGGSSVAGNAYLMGGSNGVSGGNVEISGESGGYVKIQGFKFPTTDGIGNQAIITDGSGNLSIGNATPIVPGSGQEVMFNTAGMLDGSSLLQFDGTNLIIDNILGSGSGNFLLSIPMANGGTIDLNLTGQSTNGLSSGFTGGNINITAGGAAAGVGGNLNLSGGTSSSNVGGNVVIGGAIGGMGNGDVQIASPCAFTSGFGLYGTTPPTQQTANAALTDSTGGTPSTTLAPVIGTLDDMDINNNFASLVAQLAAIRTLLLAYGLGV